MRQVMWYDSARGKWRYLVEPGFATGGGLRIDSSQMPGEQMFHPDSKNPELKP